MTYSILSSGCLLETREIFHQKKKIFGDQGRFGASFSPVSHSIYVRFSPLLAKNSKSILREFDWNQAIATVKRVGWDFTCGFK
jgi:hypothetical protein